MAEVSEKPFISPKTLGLLDLEVSLVDAKAEGPDEDGDVRLEIHARLVNKTDTDCEYLAVRTQLFSSNGMIVGETVDGLEQTICAADEGEIEVNLNSRFSLLGEKADRASLLIHVVACGAALEDMGSMNVPLETYAIQEFGPLTLGEHVKLLRGSLWRVQSDDEGDAGVEVRALVQNVSRWHLPEVKILADVVDKARREVTDASGLEEASPGEVRLITGYGIAKDKQLNGSKVSLALRAYYPVAAGWCYQVGIEISRPDADNEDDDVEDDWASEDDAEGSDGTSIEDGDDEEIENDDAGEDDDTKEGVDASAEDDIIDGRSGKVEAPERSSNRKDVRRVPSPAATRGHTEADSTNSRLLVVTPKEHAEWVFYPSRSQMRKSGSAHKDVGVSIDHGEVVAIDPITKPEVFEGKFIALVREGRIELDNELWEYWKKPLRDATTVFDIKRILEEYESA